MGAAQLSVEMKLEHEKENIKKLEKEKSKITSFGKSIENSYKDLLNQINNKFPALNTNFEIYYENKKKINTKILNKKEYEIFINNNNIYFKFHTFFIF